MKKSLVIDNGTRPCGVTVVKGNEDEMIDLTVDALREVYGISLNNNDTPIAIIIEDLIEKKKSVVEVDVINRLNESSTLSFTLAWHYENKILRFTKGVV